MIGLGHALSHSLAPQGAAAPPFAGALDAFTAGLTVCWDIKRRLLSSYTGAACLVRADRAGQPTYEVQYLPDGAWDTAGLMSFAGMDDVCLVQPYSQYGSLAFGQASAAAQPLLVTGGVLIEDGAYFEAGAGKFIEAELTSVIDIVAPNQGQICMRLVAADGNAAFRSNLSDLRLLVTYADCVWLICGGGGQFYTYTPGYNGHLIDASFERYEGAGTIRVNDSVRASAPLGDLPTDIGPEKMIIGSSAGEKISALLVWNTCDATLAAERSAALA